MDLRLTRPPYKLKEAEWQGQVLRMAKLFGWLAHHVRPGLNRRGRWSTAIQGDRGFADLVLVHEHTGDLILVELKRDDGRLTPEQERWRAAILAGGPQRFVVWRPKDFDLVRARLMCHHSGPRRGDDAPGPGPRPIQVP